MTLLSEDEEARIVIVAYDDYTDIDLILMWDLFKRVPLPNWNVRIIGDAPVHRSMTGLETRVHGQLREANDAHAVLFTSGKGNRAKIQDPGWLSQFRLRPEEQLIGSICSGALILAALGLLDGQHATTYPTARGLLEAYGVRVVDEPFVRNGNVATAATCLAAPALVAWVVAELVGPEMARDVVASAQPVGRSAPEDWVALVGQNYTCAVEAVA